MAVMTRHQKPTMIHEGTAADVPGIAPTNMKPIIALNTESRLSRNIPARMMSAMMAFFCIVIINLGYVDFTL